MAVNPTFLVFGVVREYTYNKWNSKEGQEKWNNYSNNHKRLDIEWEPMVSETNSQRYIDETMGKETKPGETNKYVDLPVAIPSTHHSKVKVLRKKNNCNVHGLNSFIQQWISNHFKFNIHSGWKFKTVGK